MARTGLVTLRDQLRGMCEAGTADYTVGTITYWADNGLDDVLDRHRVDILREQLTAIEKYTGGGTIEYHDYYSAFGPYEQTTGGTAIFQVQTSIGDTMATTTYNVDYLRGLVTFTSDTLGSAMMLTGRSYDMNAAAADVWRAKAAHYAAAFDFSTDNHNLRRSQLLDHCTKMAAFYEQRAGMGGQAWGVSELARSDTP